MGSSSRESRAAVFFIFCEGTFDRWKSATAAALTMTLAGCRFSNTLSRISRAVCTAMNVQPRGGARWTGPEMSTTLAPRAAAASASAYPILPLERLEM